MKAFLVLAVLYSPEGGLSALRIGSFEIPEELRDFFGLSTEMYNGMLDDGYLPEDSEYVYYPYLCRMCGMTDFEERFTVEDIPIGELKKRLGDENVKCWDRDNFIGIEHYPINIICSVTKGIWTGKVIIGGCCAIAKIRSGGNIAENIYQAVGMKGLYPRKRRSKVKVVRHPAGEKLFLVSPDGGIELIPLEELIGKLDDSLRPWDRPDFFCDKPPEKKPGALKCGNVYSDGTFSGRFVYAEAHSGEKYGDSFAEKLTSYLMAGVCENFEREGDSVCDAHVTELPQNSPVLLMVSGGPPLDVRAINENTCRTVACPDVAVERVTLAKSTTTMGSGKFYCMYDPYSLMGGRPGNFSGAFLYGNASAGFDLVKLPRIAADGFELNADRIEKLIMPEYCSGTMMLKLSETDMKTLDLVKYRRATQLIDLGKSPFLETVRLGGKGDCCFCGSDLRSLRSIKVKTKKLGFLKLELDGLVQDTIDIDIDVTNIKRQPRDLMAQADPFGADRVGILICIGAKKPVKINIRQNRLYDAAIKKASGSAPVSFSYTTEG